MKASGVILRFNGLTIFHNTYKTNRKFSTMIVSSRLLKFLLNSRLFTKKVLQTRNNFARTITEEKGSSSLPNNDEGNVRLVVCSVNMYHWTRI